MGRSKLQWQAIFFSMINSGDLLSLTRADNPNNRLVIPKKYDKITVFQRGLNPIAITNVLRIDGFLRPGVNLAWSNSPINTRNELRFNRQIRIDITFSVSDGNWDTYSREGNL